MFVLPVLQLVKFVMMQLHAKFVQLDMFSNSLRRVILLQIMFMVIHVLLVLIGA